MSSDAVIDGNLLLDVPGEVLHQILAFYDIHFMIRVLWMTGSKALQARMRRWTSAVRVKAEGRPWTDLNDPPQKFALPACFAEFSQLEVLSVYAGSHGVAVECMDVLKKINPGLRRLDLAMPSGNNIFKPRVPRPATEAQQEDGSCPKVGESRIDLSVTFPHLEVFHFRAEDPILETDVDLCLPPGLTSLLCDFPKEEDEDELAASSLTCRLT